MPNYLSETQFWVIDVMPYSIVYKTTKTYLRITRVILDVVKGFSTITYIDIST